MKDLRGRLGGLLRSALKYVVHHPLAAAATVLLVLFAISAMAFGKKVQIGGLLSLLWGDKKGPSVRGIPPADRVDENRAPILPGQSDDRGFVQAPVTTSIVEPGIFSDPTEIVVQHPEKGEVTIKLPEGVKNKDVQEVVEVTPDVYEVRNKDAGASPKKLDDLIGKLGG